MVEQFGYTYDIEEQTRAYYYTNLMATSDISPSSQFWS